MDIGRSVDLSMDIHIHGKLVHCTPSGSASRKLYKLPYINICKKNTELCRGDRIVEDIKLQNHRFNHYKIPPLPFYTVITQALIN